MDDKRGIRPETKPQMHRTAEDRNQNLYIENRQKATISGVLNVQSFNEAEIIIETVLGILTIKGTGMHINKLNLEAGDLMIDGNIDSCAYSEKRDLKTKSAGFFSKVFR